MVKRGGSRLQDPMLIEFVFLIVFVFVFVFLIVFVLVFVVEFVFVFVFVFVFLVVFVFVFVLDGPKVEGEASLHISCSKDTSPIKKKLLENSYLPQNISLPANVLQCGGERSAPGDYNVFCIGLVSDNDYLYHYHYHYHYLTKIIIFVCGPILVNFLSCDPLSWLQA